MDSFGRDKKGLSLKYLPKSKLVHLTQYTPLQPESNPTQPKVQTEDCEL